MRSPIASALSKRPCTCCCGGEARAGRRSLISTGAGLEGSAFHKIQSAYPCGRRREIETADPLAPRIEECHEAGSRVRPNRSPHRNLPTATSSELKARPLVHKVESFENALVEGVDQEVALVEKIELVHVMIESVDDDAGFLDPPPSPDIGDHRP